MEQTTTQIEEGSEARPGAKGHETKALTSFLKAIKAVGLYPEGSPVPEKLAGAFAADLVPCFGESDRVQITFRSDAIQLNGVPVTATTDESWDLPASLFEVGLRDLTFLPGVSPAELTSLTRLLSRAARRELNPAEEDLSVLLWEMDLPGIAYRVVEVGDESESAASFESDEPGGDGAEMQDLWESLHPLERYLQKRDELDIVTPEDLAAAVSEKKLEELRTQAKREPRDMGRKFVLVLLEIVVHDMPRSEFERVEALLPEFFIKLLSLGQFRTFLWLAARLLERVHQLADSEAKDLSELGPRILGEEAAAAALGALRAGRCDDPDSAMVFLRSLRSEGLVATLEEAAEGGRGPGKREIKEIPPRVIAEVTAERADDLLADPDRIKPSHLQFLGSLLNSDPFGSRDVEQWGRRLNPFLSSPDPEIRERVLTILADLRPSSLDQTLLDALNDPESRVRYSSVERFSELFGSQAFQPLLDIIRSDDFKDRDFEEQAVFYEALARSSPEEAFPLLERLVQRRNWLAPKYWRIEKACALRGLGEAPSEKAMPLLMRYRKVRDLLLAEACRQALAQQHRRVREEDEGTTESESGVEDIVAASNAEDESAARAA